MLLHPPEIVAGDKHTCTHPWTHVVTQLWLFDLQLPHKFLRCWGKNDSMKMKWVHRQRRSGWCGWMSAHLVFVLDQSGPTVSRLRPVYDSWIYWGLEGLDPVWVHSQLKSAALRQASDWNPTSALDDRRPLSFVWQPVQGSVCCSTRNTPKRCLF